MTHIEMRINFELEDKHQEGDLQSYLEATPEKPAKRRTNMRKLEARTP
jgi:hypothetical protein